MAAEQTAGPARATAGNETTREGQAAMHEQELHQSDRSAAAGGADAESRAGGRRAFRGGPGAAAAVIAAIALVSAALGGVGAHALWTPSSTNAAPVSGFSSDTSNAGTPVPGYGGGSGFRLPYGGSQSGSGSLSG